MGEPPPAHSGVPAAAGARRRLALLALGLIALLAALWGGLGRLGWALPSPGFPLGAVHGPLVVPAFLGTLIGLERAVALGHPLAFLVPLATGLGGVTWILGFPPTLGRILTTVGSAGLMAIFLVLLRRQTAQATAVMAAGAVAWFAGQLLWVAGWPLFRVVAWWMTFLVLTIAGERLELARLVRLPRIAELAFLGAAGLLGGALWLTALGGAGVRVLGLAFVALALWFGRWDVARRTVHRPGLTRFVAVALLSGYAWLGVSGVLGIVGGAVAAGPWYDAFLHAFFLGFVFAMIMGHAPLVFPAILGLPIAFRRTFYLPLGLLHLSLILRVAGDLAGWWPGRQWGGLLNAVAILLWFANTAGSALRHRARVEEAAAGPRA